MFTSLNVSVETSLQRIEIYKCNRLPNDGVKKQPCKFKKELIVQETPVHETRVLTKINKNKINNNKINNNKINNNKINKNKNVKLTLNYKNELKYILKFYSVSNFVTNFYGKLNFYLFKNGYSAHDPPYESSDELMYRISKSPIKIKNNLYIDENSQFSQTIGEYDYDLETDKCIYKRIQLKENLFEFTDDPYIKDLLKRKSKINKNKKTKSKKVVIKPSVLSITSTLKSIDILKEKEENPEENPAEKPEEKPMEEEEEEEEEDVEIDVNDKDNEFDVENYSDNDDYDDNGYDDFSD